MAEMPHAAGRRNVLLRWMKERPAHDGLSAREIADVTGIYDDFKIPLTSAYQDLSQLSVRGVVRADRSVHPIRWYVDDSGAPKEER